MINGEVHQTEADRLELLYEALNSEYGLIVKTDSVEKLRQKLYKTRLGDEALLCLSFHPSPISPETDLFIVKKEHSNDNQEQGATGEEDPEHP